MNTAVFYYIETILLCAFHFIVSVLIFFLEAWLPLAPTHQTD